jgi:hypothetical protein
VKVALSSAYTARCQQQAQQQHSWTGNYSVRRLQHQKQQQQQLLQQQLAADPVLLAAQQQQQQQQLGRLLCKQHSLMPAVYW